MLLSRSFRFGLSVIKLLRHQCILAKEKKASSAQHKPHLHLRALWTYSQEEATLKNALWERRKM